MKWIVLVVFAAAFCGSLIWLDRAERKLTQLQQTALGAAALAGWVLVAVLGATIL